MRHSALGAVLLFVACHGSPKQEAAPAAASLVAAAASASAAPAPAVWFLGGWQGSYKAELHRLEVAVGGVKAWKEDDGTLGSGEGKLALEAQADGSVIGTASGALGEQTVAGRFEGERLSLTLTPTQADGFHGVILASQSAQGVQGTLSASSADSLSVRQASISLAKAGK